MKNIIQTLFVVLLIFTSCANEPNITDDMVDSGKVYDLSNYPINNLLSERYKYPTVKDLNMPVIIAAHGFSASTFEWDELREKSETMGEYKFYISQVLLGGHGSDYQAFKEATWKDWQSSIKEEYEKLRQIGYKNIYLAGSSTGAPLIINLFSDGYFNDENHPKGVFLIDPIIVSSNKTLTLVNALGPVLGFVESGNNDQEISYWYSYRPYQALQQLMGLIDLTRKDLQKGIVLPKDCFMKTYKTTVDGAADPVSAVLIWKGVENSDGSKTEVEMVDSHHHVFTRLKYRDGVTEKDWALQKRVFDEMLEKISG